MEKEYSVHVAEQSIIDKFMEVECLKTRESLNLGNPISRIQLQSLAPRTPGRHRVYRLINNTLETGLSEYRLSTLMEPLGNNPIIVRDSKGDLIKYNYWVSDDIHHVIDGPNGMFLYKGRISYHNADILDYQHAIALSLKQKVELNGLITMPVYHTLEDGVQTMYSKIKPGQVEPLFNFHWSSGWTWFSYISMSIIGLILLTSIIKILRLQMVGVV